MEVRLIIIIEENNVILTWQDKQLCPTSKYQFIADSRISIVRHTNTQTILPKDCIKPS